MVTCAFAVCLCVGFTYQHARARISETFFEIGEQMMRYEAARHQDAPRNLSVNGQHFRLSSGTVYQSLDQVLSTFERRCADLDGGITAQLESLTETHPELDETSSVSVLRDQTNEEGWVACLDMRSSVNLGEIVERLRSYNESGNVADIGHVRYVFAEEGEHNGQTSTHFVGMWTTGDFNLDVMFPESGDAPGEDVQGVRRPPASRRVLSGAEEGTPHRIVVYQSAQSEAELHAFYTRSLVQDGWRLIETDSSTGARNAPPTLFAEYNDRMITIILRSDEQTGATAAIFDMP